MNDLTNISPEMTMSSMEIAELTGKRHDNVMRDIRSVLTELHWEGGLLRFEDTQKNPQNGQQYPIFRLPKRETLVLVAGYSIELRARIIDRWQELEEATSNPAALLNDPAKLRALLLDNVEKVLALQEENSELKPLAASYEHLTKADGSFCITDAAKALGIRPKDLFNDLREMKWIYRRAGCAHWIGYGNREQQGLIEHKVT